MTPLEALTVTRLILAIKDYQRPYMGLYEFRAADDLKRKQRELDAAIRDVEGLFISPTTKESQP